MQCFNLHNIILYCNHLCYCKSTYFHLYLLSYQQRQKVEEESPDFPFTLSNLPGISQVAPNPERIQNPFSEYWGCPKNYSQGLFPVGHPRSILIRCMNHLCWLCNVDEQWLHAKLTPGDGALQPPPISFCISPSLSPAILNRKLRSFHSLICRILFVLS